MTESLHSSRPIAALYVTKSGSYFGLEGVDPWDEERDARLYDGPYPQAGRKRITKDEASRTPETFRDALIALARSARVTSEAVA